MSLRVLWFVVAGFILGFATSTLWEWLYYRGKRRTELAQSARPIVHPTPSTPAHAELEASIEQPQATWALPYRSPGVYLESEQPQVQPQLQPSEATSATEASSPIVLAAPIDQTDVPDTMGTTIAPPSTPAVPRINPATLALLQSTVTKTPIAQPVSVKSVSTEVPVTRPPDPIPVSAAPLVTTPEAHALIQLEKVTQVKITEDEGAETNHPDDLALIKGVGEAYKRLLYDAGVYTWRQVAESETENLRRITRAKPNANISGWRQQAQALAEKYQRWDTTFQGPLDDFTRIESIGAITADMLYKAGLCTYEQLASALPDELAKIVPAHTVGDEIDFAGWIKAAARLANTKRRNQELFP